MKSFNSVYNDSKKEVMALKATLYESQKVSVVNVLKENYMITGNISDLPKEVQRNFAQKLLEYWSPKTGINRAGQRLLAENELTLTPQSKKDDIKVYIGKQVRKHLVAITEAYKANNVKAVMDAFRADIEPQIQKTLKESFLNNTIWDIVSERIKQGL